MPPQKVAKTVVAKKNPEVKTKQPALDVVAEKEPSKPVEKAEDALEKLKNPPKSPNLPVKAAMAQEVKKEEPVDSKMAASQAGMFGGMQKNLLILIAGLLAVVVVGSFLISGRSKAN